MGELRTLPLPVTTAGRLCQRAPTDADPGELVYAVVANDGLQDQHIMLGDFLLIQRSNVLTNGELVLVQHRTAGPLVGFVEFGGKKQIVLHYANPTHRPSCFPLSSVRLIGRAIRVERDLW